MSGWVRNVCSFDGVSVSTRRVPNLRWGPQVWEWCTGLVREDPGQTKRPGRTRPGGPCGRNTKSNRVSNQ